MAIGTEGLPPFQPYPEWRQLKANIQPLLETQTKFTYDELRELAGIDIQSPKGRLQFYRFRQSALKEWDLWFEVVTGEGYEVIPAGKHSVSAVKRVRQAGRKVNLARAIQHHVRLEGMSPEELYLHANTTVLIDNLATDHRKTAKGLAAVASKYKLGVSEEDLKTLGDPAPKKGATKAAKFRID